MQLLFVCKSNSGRSQMAAALFNGLSKNKAESAGFRAKKEGKVGLPPNPLVVRAMNSVGYDLSSCKRRQIDNKAIKKANLIIILLTPKERRLYVPGNVARMKTVRFWNVKDMKDTPYAAHVEGRRRISKLVKKLVKETG